MAGWEKVIISDPEQKEFDTKPLNWKRVKFLVDENLGEGTAEVLSDLGFNAEFANDVGLSGRSDEDVLGYAWRKGRVLLSHDTDFLDDTRFPEHRNPGVIILPGGSGEDEDLWGALHWATEIFAHGPKALRGAKVKFTSWNEFQIRRRNRKTGAMEQTRYKITPDDLFKWIYD